MISFHATKGIIILIRKISWKIILLILVEGILAHTMKPVFAKRADAPIHISFTFTRGEMPRAG